MNKRILVILGHPSDQSFCSSLAKSYIDGARKSGNEIKFISLGQLAFDPVLRSGYASTQSLEPDLQTAQTAISWAQHLVFVYPTWWGTMPALLKGFIDRVFLPGFAFKYREGSHLWDRLLSGRSAQLIVTMDSPPWYFRWISRMPGHNQMKRTVLGFCGIEPVVITSLGPVKGATLHQREKWLSQARRSGENV